MLFSGGLLGRWVAPRFFFFLLHAFSGNWNTPHTQPAGQRGSSSLPAGPAGQPAGHSVVSNAIKSNKPERQWRYINSSVESCPSPIKIFSVGTAQRIAVCHVCVVVFHQGYICPDVDIDYRLDDNTVKKEPLYHTCMCRQGTIIMYYCCYVGQNGGRKYLPGLVDGA